MSDSQQPHGLQTTRLLCPRDFPGKSTGVGCHCLLPGPSRGNQNKGRDPRGWSLTTPSSPHPPPPGRPTSRRHKWKLGCREDRGRCWFSMSARGQNPERSLSPNARIPGSRACKGSPHWIAGRTEEQRTGPSCPLSTVLG